MTTTCREVIFTSLVLSCARAAMSSGRSRFVGLHSMNRARRCEGHEHDQEMPTHVLQDRRHLDRYSSIWRGTGRGASRPDFFLVLDPSTRGTTTDRGK